MFADVRGRSRTFAELPPPTFADVRGRSRNSCFCRKQPLTLDLSLAYLNPIILNRFIHKRANLFRVVMFSCCLIVFHTNAICIGLETLAAPLCRPAGRKYVQPPTKPLTTQSPTLPLASSTTYQQLSLSHLPLPLIVLLLRQCCSLNIFAATVCRHAGAQPPR